MTSSIPIRIDAAGKTDPGKKRERNEDQFLVADLEKAMSIRETSLDVEDQTKLFAGLKGCVLVVADGMGGHSHGDRASSLAVRAVTGYTLNTLSWFFNLDPARDDDLKEELGRALERCRGALRADAERQNGDRSMGTTVTLCYVLWPKAYIVHAGDSRAYLHRGGEVNQLTTDHTLAQQLVDAGAMTEKQAETSRHAHVLYNAVQADEESEVTPEVKRISLEVEDTVLLVSDGVTKHVTDEQIARVVSTEQSAESIVDRLVAMANEGGGTDNITAVVARLLRG